MDFFWPQNTFFSIHICKQVFKVTESEFLTITLKNRKNGKVMKFKYEKNVVPYVTQANSGITLEVFNFFIFFYFFLLTQIQGIKEYQLLEFSMKFVLFFITVSPYF